MTQYQFAIASHSSQRTGIREQPSRLAGQPSPLLLTRFIEGDNAAFEELFNLHNHKLYAYCLKIVGSEEAAEDITQEMWERVLRLRVEPKKVDNPVGLFVTIVRNLSLNYLRGRKRLSPLDDLVHQIPDGMRERSAREEMVLMALEKLSFDYREVLILNAYSGYTLEEIAQMLGKSSEAIWKRASRARAKLSSIVQDMLDAEGRSMENMRAMDTLSDGGRHDR